MVKNCDLSIFKTSVTVFHHTDLPAAILYFGILILKNWLRLLRQFKLDVESYEPADEEELSTFSLGMEFLTPPKERVHLHAWIHLSVFWLI